MGVDDGLFAGSGLEVLEVLWVIFGGYLCGGSFIVYKCYFWEKVFPRPPWTWSCPLSLPWCDSLGNSPETSRFFIYVSMVMSCIRNKICIFAILMTDTRIL